MRKYSGSAATEFNPLDISPVIAIRFAMLNFINLFLEWVKKKPPKEAQKDTSTNRIYLAPLNIQAASVFASESLSWT